MTIVEKARELPDRIKSAVSAFTQFEQPKSPDLNEVAEKAARVVQMMGTEGYRVVQGEREAQESMLLSRFIGSEVTNWEKFLELRGFANGILAAGNIESQVVAAGIKAEKALVERRR